MGNGNIFIIGPRSSGKTTYLAGLAYLPKLQQQGRAKNFGNIIPQDENAEKLQDKAENILLQGGSFEPTKKKDGSVYEEPTYLFRLQFQPRFNQKKEEYELAVWDYAGEVFDKLSAPQMKPDDEEYWENLFQDSVGCLILLAGWQQGDDQQYAQNLKVFTDLMDFHKRRQNLRVAVVMSKCERGELWSGRIEPEIDIFDLHLPRSKAILSDKIPQKNLHFFALSTFGVLSSRDPRPNRIDQLGKEISVIRETPRWKPYNLIAPLYWLATGKKIDTHG